MYKHKAIYPGSFDPITNGHVFIAERAAALFDELEVSILINSGKKGMFPLDERVELTRKALAHIPNVTVSSFSGLLVDFLRERKSSIIIRGLRALSDFEYEFHMALMNRHLSPEVETLFIVTDAKSSYLSSHSIKEACFFGGNIKELVPDCVYEPLLEKVALLKKSGLAE